MYSFQEQSPGHYWLSFQAPFSADDEEAYLASLHALSALEVPYIVIAVFGGHTPLSDPGRKAQNLWFKANRDKIGLHCQGLVRVSDHYEIEGPDQGNFAKAVPFPVLNVRTVDVVQAQIDRHLNQETSP